MSHSPEDLEKQVEDLRFQLKEVREELDAIKESPYLQTSVRTLRYEVVLDRTEVMSRELGQKINEKHGSMYEVKNQARRLSHLLGLDADMVRVMVTEALQNIIEHGYGRYCTVLLELRNDAVNPCLVSTFKHELPPGERYTLDQINSNARKGDVTSEHFDFESSRGRGEFIMKQLTDERRIINGLEVNPDGRKVNYFKRILINYKNPGGARERVSFQEIKDEIDRLDYEDIVCCFHVDHRVDRPDSVTIAASKGHLPKVLSIMNQHGFRIVEQEPYYRTVFATFVADHAADRDELIHLFARVRQVVYQEVDGSKGPV